MGKDSKKRLTADEIKEAKNMIRSVREKVEVPIKDYDVKKGHNIVEYFGGGITDKKEVARVKDRTFKDTSDLYFTNQKLVTADDYAKKGRVDEAYALLGNALEKFNPNIKPVVGKIKEEDIKNVYESIGKRAMRYSKITDDVRLARQLKELAEKAERYATGKK